MNVTVVGDFNRELMIMVMDLDVCHSIVYGANHY